MSVTFSTLCHVNLSSFKCDSVTVGYSGQLLTTSSVFRCTVENLRIIFCLHVRTAHTLKDLYSNVLNLTSNIELTRSINMAELRKLRRQFISYTKMHPTENTGQISNMFVQYLNKSLHWNVIALASFCIILWQINIFKCLLPVTGHFGFIYKHLWSEIPKAMHFFWMRRNCSHYQAKNVESPDKIVIYNTCILYTD